MTQKMVVLGALAAVLVSAAVPARAGLFAEADGGYFACWFGSSGQLGMHRVHFVWSPHYQASTPGLDYFVIAECKRWRLTGGLEGNLKRVIVRNIRITGLDSRQTVFVPKLTTKVRDGASPAVWHYVPELASLAATDAFALVEAAVQIRGSVSDGGVTCYLRVQEQVMSASSGAGPEPLAAPWDDRAP